MTFKGIDGRESSATKSGNVYIKYEDGRFLTYWKSDDTYAYRAFDLSFSPDDLLNDKTPFEIYKKPILNEAEKKYLSEILDPLKNFFRAILITKFDAYDSDEAEYIVISFIDDKNDCSEWNFPLFKKGTKYAMLREGRAYELEELGL